MIRIDDISVHMRIVCIRGLVAHESERKIPEIAAFPQLPKNTVYPLIACVGRGREVKFVPLTQLQRLPWQTAIGGDPSKSGDTARPRIDL
jgi:hypothetical protein